MVIICTTSLTFNKSTFCPHSVFMCFVWIWEQTAIISLYSVNWLVCITDTQFVHCAVRPVFISVILQHTIPVTPYRPSCSPALQTNYQTIPNPRHSISSTAMFHSALYQPLPTFPHDLTVPSRRVKKKFSKPEDGTAISNRNVGNGLTLHAA